LLLPGNHDAALAESVWTRLQRLDLLPAHVIACLEPRPELLPGRLAVLPAPLLQRHTQHDLSDWFASADTPEGLPRVGLAHGFVPGVLPDEIDSSNPIAADRAERAGLDYLALGDWHGSKRIDARTWYAGTPESDRFKDNDSGQALLVDIDGPGALPRVQPLRCGRYRWQTVEAAIAVASDVEQTQRRLAELGADDVVHLRLSGRCDLAADRRLQQAADAARARVRALLYDRQALALQPTDDDIAALQADGYVGDVLQQLRAEQDGAQGERARQALILLASLLQPAGESPAKTAGEARA
jgi:DNA repair exonuclease SbcCD nuclease subunit